jgi:hypothetical protein
MPTSLLALLITLVITLGSILRSRLDIQLEILALRHQIGVLERSVQKGPRLTSTDRLLWVSLYRFWRHWRSMLLIVKPETVVAWHRKGFRLFWSWKVRHGQKGRPAISRQTRDLIRRMCCENPTWDAPHILAFMGSCPSSASTSAKVASLSTWSAAVNRRLRPGEPFWKTISRRSSRSIFLPFPPSVSRSCACSWCWLMIAVV